VALIKATSVTELAFFCGRKRQTLAKPALNAFQEDKIRGKTVEIAL